MLIYAWMECRMLKGSECVYQDLKWIHTGENTRIQKRQKVEEKKSPFSETTDKKFLPALLFS